MKKIPKSPTHMTNAELADEVLRETLKMPTQMMMAKRAARLASMYGTTEHKRPRFCFGESHCARLSCPRCRQREQRVFVVNTMRQTKQLGDGDIWQAVTIIPEFGKTAVGHLPKGGIRGFKDQCAAHVRHVAKEARLVGCVDISVERKRGEAEVWQYHIHAIASGIAPKKVRELRQRFAWPDKDEEKRSCYRPLQVKKIDDLAGFLAYMSKPQFFMREQFADANGELLFRKSKISREQELKFIKALSHFKAKHRFFRVGLK